MPRWGPSVRYFGAARRRRSQRHQPVRLFSSTPDGAPDTVAFPSNASGTQPTESHGVAPDNRKPTPNIQVDISKMHPEWHKDPFLCEGMYNQDERSALVDTLRKSKVKVVVAVDEAECDGTLHKFFVGFGFSPTSPFMAAGTAVQFQSIRDHHTLMESEVSGTIVAEGRRPQEYAVAIAFRSPVPLNFVSALLHNSFNVTEAETVFDMCSSVFSLVRHSGERGVYGDYPEELRGNEAVIDKYMGLFSQVKIHTCPCSLTRQHLLTF